MTHPAKSVKASRLMADREEREESKAPHAKPAYGAPGFPDKGGNVPLIHIVSVI
jgi:hypothetical protein